MRPALLEEESEEFEPDKPMASGDMHVGSGQTP
jgi:hypothetical protein